MARGVLEHDGHARANVRRVDRLHDCERAGGQARRHAPGLDHLQLPPEQQHGAHEHGDRNEQRDSEGGDREQNSRSPPPEVRFRYGCAVASNLNRHVTLSLCARCCAAVGMVVG